MAEELRKEAKIKKWWEQSDRKVVFRSFCNPGHDAIPIEGLNSYFTQRECKVLADRLDPNKTGKITFDFFQ